MNKKQPVSRFSKTKLKTRSTVRSWHNEADLEIDLYARSLQKAAKALVEKHERENTRTDWDACPVVLLYREALELHLKALVGEGSNFLESRTDPLTLAKTHSLRWLAQIVCRIIKAVGWESDFTCEGVTSLADFSAVVNEVESLDPVARALRSSRPTGPSSVSEYYRTFNIVEFAKKLDAVRLFRDVWPGPQTREGPPLTRTMVETQSGRGQVWLHILVSRMLKESFAGWPHHSGPAARGIARSYRRRASTSPLRGSSSTQSLS